MLSVSLLCVVQILFLHIVRRQAASRGRQSWPYACVYLLLVVSSPSYITWMTITLMDTCLWGFILACFDVCSGYTPSFRQPPLPRSFYSWDSMDDLNSWFLEYAYPRVLAAFL
jgi:hypothetical protein